MEKLNNGVSHLLQSEKKVGSGGLGSPTGGSEEYIGPAVAAAVSGMTSPRYRSSSPFSDTTTSGYFFEALTSSDFYKHTKVLLLNIIIIYVVPI